MQAFLFFIFLSFFVFLTQTVGHTPRCSVETGDENRHDFHCMQMIEAVDARVLKIKYSEKYSTVDSLDKVGCCAGHTATA